LFWIAKKEKNIEGLGASQTPTNDVPLEGVLSLPELHHIFERNDTCVLQVLTCPMQFDTEGFPLAPPPLERSFHSRITHSVEEIQDIPSIWKDSYLRLLVRRNTGTNTCSLFMRCRVKQYWIGSYEVVQNGKYQLTVQLNWNLDLNTGNLVHCFRTDVRLFNIQLCLKQTRCSRAMVRTIVMLKVLANRAKKRLVFRKASATIVHSRLGWQAAGLVSSFLWTSRSPKSVYVDREE
jgi:hypothetical protein